MNTTDWLEGLNPEQREAVEHFEGPVLVLAGAGSGKTRVLTTRIAHLTEEHGVDPAAVLAVTFTNKAAGEMRERVRRLLGGDPAGMWVGTFHSIGARLLRRHATALGWTPAFSIFDAEQAQREVKRVMETLNLSPKRWNPKAVHGAISAAKNQLVLPTEYARLAADPFTDVVARVYPAYQKALEEQNAFDFDDLLVMPVELFRRHAPILRAYRRRFRFILVDEYQDTNRAQYVFLRLLAARRDGDDVPEGERDDLGGNIMVVGDDDQSIYGWRGADIRNILDFETDFPGARIVRLERNYRSTARILEAANHVIAQNVRRKGKTLRTQAGRGEALTRVEAWDERDEAEWVVGEILERLADDPAHTARDFVVLYRTNAQSRSFEEAFRRHDVPYQIVGGTRFYERREIMDVLAYMRLISNPRDAAAFDRIVNYPRRGIGDTTKAALYTWAVEQGISPLEAARRADDIPDIRGAGASALRGFADRIQRFAALATQLSVGFLLEQLIEEIGLLVALREEGPEGEDRIDNVRELLAGAHDFDALADAADEEEEDAPEGSTAVDRFLQKVSLLTDVDRRDPDANAVTLMTMHNAKGLEFPFVFIGGLEEGLFPLSRSFDERDALEEERRLFYVGITRARRKLYLSHARKRRRAGEVMPCIPSSFLEPIPTDLLEVRRTRELERMRSDYGFPRRRRADSAWSRETPAFEGASDGVYIDYTDAQEAPRFVKGERVRHPQFGRGVIRELSGLGQDLKAVIDFDRIGRKKVIVRYANLQKEL